MTYISSALTCAGRPIPADRLRRQDDQYVYERAAIPRRSGPRRALLVTVLAIIWGLTRIVDIRKEL